MVASAGAGTCAAASCAGAASGIALFLQESHPIEFLNGWLTLIIVGVAAKDADDVIGIVTVHDGPALREGEIIAPTAGNEAGDSNRTSWWAAATEAAAAGWSR